MQSLQKEFFTFGKRYKRDIACKVCCVGHQDNRTFFLPKSKYRIKLTGDIEGTSKIQTDSVSHITAWIVCTHHSSIGSIAKLLQKLDKWLIMWSQQSTLNTERSKQKILNCPRKKLVQRNSENFQRGFREMKSTQTTGFEESFWQVKEKQSFNWSWLKLDNVFQMALALKLVISSFHYENFEYIQKLVA